jgi:hypothetical protein
MDYLFDTYSCCFRIADFRLWRRWQWLLRGSEPDRQSDPHTDSYTNAGTYFYANPHANPNANSDTHTVTDANTDAHARSNPNTDANAYSRTQRRLDCSECWCISLPGHKSGWHSMGMGVNRVWPARHWANLRAKADVSRSSGR